MKIGKYLSLISIIIATIFVVLKFQFDLATYKIMLEVISVSDGDISPTIFAGGIKVVVLYIIPVLVSLVLSIIGFKRKNIFRRLALGVNIFTIIYLIVPVGILIAMSRLK